MENNQKYTPDLFGSIDALRILLSTYDIELKHCQSEEQRILISENFMNNIKNIAQNYEYGKAIELSETNKSRK